LKKRSDQCANIFVTHRLGAVRTADQIIVLEHGKIVEAGNFDELMEKKGRFSYIWKEQMKWYQ
jgi:ATP-binding cassette subfamily B protein